MDIWTSDFDFIYPKWESESNACATQKFPDLVQYTEIIGRVLISWYCTYRTPFLLAVAENGNGKYIQTAISACDFSDLRERVDVYHDSTLNSASNENLNQQFVLK